jgi:hypothetical protein
VPVMAFTEFRNCIVWDSAPHIVVWNGTRGFWEQGVSLTTAYRAVTNRITTARFILPPAGFFSYSSGRDTVTTLDTDTLANRRMVSGTDGDCKGSGQSERDRPGRWFPPQNELAGLNRAFLRSARCRRQREVFEKRQFHAARETSTPLSEPLDHPPPVEMGRLLKQELVLSISTFAIGTMESKSSFNRLKMG